MYFVDIRAVSSVSSGSGGARSAPVIRRVVQVLTLNACKRINLIRIELNYSY